MKSFLKSGFYTFSILGSVLCGLILSACTPKKSIGPRLTVLAYSSLGGKGSFLEKVKEDFQSKSGCELQVETTLGAAQVLSFLEEPKQRERLDLVMGLDELLFERAKQYFFQGDLSSLKIKDSLNEFAKKKMEARPGLIPLDYGALSFIYRKSDFKNGLKIPESLQDLLDPSLRKKWLIQDPRASSPGMIFFLFSDSILKIKSMKSQWLTLAPSWDSSYKMFMAKEAPMVWSYLSSLAYHASQNEQDQYGYVKFKEGLPVQLEGMAILNRVGNPFNGNPCVEKWVHFVLSPETQEKLVQKQWMMPVVQGVKLPAFFDSIPKLDSVAVIDVSSQKVDAFIERFGKEVLIDKSP